MIFTVNNRKSTTFRPALHPDSQPYPCAGGRLVKRTNFIKSGHSCTTSLVHGVVQRAPSLPVQHCSACLGLFRSHVQPAFAQIINNVQRCRCSNGVRQRACSSLSVLFGPIRPKLSNCTECPGCTARPTLYGVDTAVGVRQVCRCWTVCTAVGRCTASFV